MDSISLEVIGLVVSIFLLIISCLLAWIGAMNRNANNTIIVRMDKQDDRMGKHDQKFDKQQQEIHALNMSTQTAIELIKQEQKQGQERLRIFQENFFDKRKGKK